MSFYEKESFVAANKEYVSTFSSGDLPLPPKKRYVISTPPVYPTLEREANPRASQ